MSLATATPASGLRALLGVVARRRTYASVAYLLLGLPLGTAWFTLLVAGGSVAISLVVVALVGIPLLVGMGHVTRVAANVERATANALLGCELPSAPAATGERGNPWVRLRAMSADRRRWREAWFLLARFPAGIATFTLAVVAVVVPGALVAAPFRARYDDGEPFGTWRYSDRLQEWAGAAWAWLLVPLGVLLLVAALHLLVALAKVCARWADRALAP